MDMRLAIKWNAKLNAQWDATCNGEWHEALQHMPSLSAFMKLPTLLNQTCCMRCGRAVLCLSGALAIMIRIGLRLGMELED